MKNILVTGGAGFIGSHTCKALARAGYFPIAYDNLERGHASSVRWGPLEVGDVGDRTALGAVLRRYRPAAVVHLAGYGYVGESMAQPQLYYDNNVARAGRMLESLREAGLRHVLYSSSCATYGGQHALPIDERAEQRPMSTYGFTKLAFERMLQDYARAHGFRGIALRYFNAAGADPEGELGEMHEPEPHFIPCALRVAAGADPVLRINGRDHPTPDGTCVRDYVHVDDLARGHLLALSALLDGGASGALNLGTGVGHSLREVVAAVERVTGRPVPVEYAPRRDGDPAYAVADPRRAAETLGWKAAYPGIETMVEHAWRWSRQGASGAGGQARAQDRAAAAAR